MARPTKLTPEINEQICRAIRAGNRQAVAARAAGVGESTFFHWMHEGRTHKTGIHRDFWEAVLQAEAESEAHAVALIRKEAPKSWRAAGYLLERRHGWVKPTDQLRQPEEERPTIDPKELSEKELKTLEGIHARSPKRS
jgi:hypothetical protein